MTNSVLSLELLALTKIAIQVYRHPDISALEDEAQSIIKYMSVQEWEPKVREKVSYLPSSLQKKVVALIIPLSYQINNWYTDHIAILECDLREHPVEFVWKYNGIIDRLKTAKSFIHTVPRAMSLGIRKCCSIVSFLCCNDDSIPTTCSAAIFPWKVKEKWRKWRQELENYLLATEKDERADKIEIAILLNLFGSERLEIYNTFKFESPESKANFSEVLKFEDYCSPRKNVVYERYIFFSCVQLEGQRIESYVTHLKTLASTCKFAEQENGLMRDRIVLGINKDSGLQERLLQENNVSLEKAIEIVRAVEEIRNMKYETVMINFVKKKENPNQPKKSSQYEYKKCGKKHKPRECPAFGKICTKCNKKNHFAVIGEFPSEPYHITLKDYSVPVIHPPRRVPQTLQPKLKSTLNNLEKEGIVSKVKKPTDLVQNDIISRLEGKKIFSVVDLKDGFWHVPLDEVSSEICTFNTHFGRVELGKRTRTVLCKQLLAKAPILKVFSASDEIVIQCDSSKDGLGSCLIQKGQPVSFGSRSLTNSEKNYAQIEKELLAIVFSFEKYHNFVYGRKVAIQSDHNPLMVIVKKPVHKISSRMQRMIFKLLKYDFEIIYVPGNQMFLADILSRAFPVNETVRDDPEMLNIVHTASKHLPMSEKRLAQF
ncbi:retrovirus-related Pol polyprotein from transposon 297 [Nephila pilipes]|uniref:Retrovirus-related Pol polyprotein from transposon 297 n=1 Tax=Nephila pilipes TaxID=299642 RepID=A0A8X6PE44_NEPPI|nr:retrovirus-related Pol polyprotein from transposon 297 [Nephila pilipes]